MEEEQASLANDELKKQMDLLTSIKGVGVTLPAALIVVAGSFTYFDNAKQFTRYLGLSPTYQQSGTYEYLFAYIISWLSFLSTVHFH